MSKATDRHSLRVDLSRLKSDILTLARIGRHEDNRGIYRMAFTDADMEGKQWLRERIEAAGLECRTDGAANVSGTLSGLKELPTVVVGSHIDTVPCAGTLDGSLGVLSALECLRVMRENRVFPRRPIEVISFTDEEGRFGGMFGSQAVCGLISPESLYVRDLDDVTLANEMERHGLDPLDALGARRDPQSIHCYLELHIEQGPVLDQTRKPAGIVDEITGLFKWAVRLHGVANHAGTTPMDMRQDAFMGLADFAHELPRIIDENGGERSRATIGKARIRPGAANTVPGLVEFSLDVRDTNAGILDDLSTAFRKALSAIARRRGLLFEFEEISRIEPVPCSPSIVACLENAASRLDIDALRMPSGAAHDAQIMASLCPVGMIFTPSQDGKSHTPAEWTSWSDIETAANLMLAALLDLSEDEEPWETPTPPERAAVETERRPPPPRGSESE